MRIFVKSLVMLLDHGQQWVCDKQHRSMAGSGITAPVCDLLGVGWSHALPIARSFQVVLYMAKATICLAQHWPCTVLANKFEVLDLFHSAMNMMLCL